MAKKQAPDPTIKAGRVRPFYTDLELVQSICSDLRRGISELATSLRHGMSDRTVHMWVSRWRTAMNEAEPTNEDRVLIECVTPIVHARGEWIAEMEERAQAGDSGAQWMLPRRVQDVYGQRQEVAVSTVPDSGVAKLLAKLAGEKP